MTVTGEAPLIDSTSSTTGTQLAGKVIDKLPLPAATTRTIVFSQPGVRPTTARRRAASRRGSAASRSTARPRREQFLIDGVNTTNVIKGIQGKDINNEFVQEVEVKTGGYQAEYGRNTGGIVNVITKSGGNEFHGGIFGYYNSFGTARPTAERRTTPDGTDRQRAGRPRSPARTPARKAALDLGGYAWKDRVWFFVAYDRVRSRTPRSPPTTAQRQGEQFPSTRRRTSTPQAHVEHRAEHDADGRVLLGPADPSTGTIPAEPAEPQPDATHGRLDIGGQDYGARLNQLFGSVGILSCPPASTRTASDQALRARARDPARSTRPAPIDRDVPRLTYGGFGQIFGPTVNNYSSAQTYTGDYTGYLGNNEVKVGGDYQKGTTNGITYCTGLTATEIRPASRRPETAICRWRRSTRTPRQHYHAGLLQTPCAGRRHADLTSRSSRLRRSPRRPRAKRYIQDPSKITPSFTINAGLR